MQEAINLDLVAELQELRARVRQYEALEFQSQQLANLVSSNYPQEIHQ